MDKNTTDKPNQSFISRLRNWWSNFFNNHQFFCSVVASIIASYCFLALQLPNKFSKMEENVNSLVSNIGEINMSDELDSINDRIDELNMQNEIKSINDRINDLGINIKDNNDEVNNKIKNIEDRLYQIVFMQASKKSTYEISKMSSSIDNEKFAVSLVYNDKDIVGTDMFSKEEILAEKLINKKMLITYKDTNDEDVIYFGQFNENGHWNGDCIINVYKNNKLILLTNSHYDDGKLLRYEQAFQDSGSWFISKRKNKGDYNIGETWQFEYASNEIVQDFDIKNIKLENIISLDKFKNSLNIKLQSYYNGKTSNGKYNDNTGNAYYIKFSDNGKINTLYIGNFCDGKFNDHTGNAQEIVYDTFNNINKYYHYKGIFNDNIKEGKVDRSNYVTNKQIKKILRGKDFSFELKWHNTN